MGNSGEPPQPFCYSCRHHRKYSHVDNGCSECSRIRKTGPSAKRLNQYQLMQAIEQRYGVTFWDFWGAAKQGRMCFPKMYDAKHLVDCEHYDPEKQPKCGGRHSSLDGKCGESD